MSGIGQKVYDARNASPVEHIEFWPTVRAPAVAENLHPIILCIEDQASPLAARKLVLEKSGYLVLSATTGAEALSLLRSVHVDLVLSDHYLRGEFGTAMAAKIKVLKPDVPFLIISGSEHVAALNGHVDGFISKTDGPTSLLVSIARALEL